MDTQRLTDADLEPITRPAATESAPSSDLEGGYPAWETPGSASLAPDAEEPADAAVSVTPTLPTPTPEDDADAPEAVTAEAAAETPEPEPDADPFAEERAKYEAQLQAHQERIAQYEAEQRQIARHNLDNAALWEEQQLDARLDAEWNQNVMPQAQRLQGAAQTSFINAQRARFNQARDEGRSQIAAIHRQELQAILANDPQTRQDFYTQVIEREGLPEAARARLAEVHPNDVDRLLPSLKAEYAAIAAKDHELDQLRREVEVYKRARNGADAMGGTKSSGGATDSRLTYGSPDYDPEMAYAGAGQWVRGRF